MGLKIAKSILKKLTPLFQNTSFFMQGQMDISPVSRWHNREFLKKTGGFFLKGDNIDRKICSLEPWDNTRKNMLILLLRTLIEKNVPGDMAEVGVYKGNTAKLIHHYMPERKLFLFDTFEGFTERGAEAEKLYTRFLTKKSKFSDTSLESVRGYIAPLNDNVQFHKGYFPDSIPDGFDAHRFAFVHLDADLFEPTMEGLKYFYPRMNRNGLLVVHDYNAWLGARMAVDEFFADKDELPIPMPDKSGSALIVKR
jgi:O-methyltransferase